MVYYENKDFQQTAAEKAAADLAKKSLETCQTVDGNAYFWAMFSLLIIAALCAIAYWGMGYTGVYTDKRKWVMGLGGLASLAVVGMYIPMIDCRNKRLV